MSEDPVRVGVARSVERLTAEPERGSLTYRASTALEAGGLRCDTALRKHAIVVDEPPSVGGTNEGPNPIEVVLAGLASCQAITYQVWAALEGVALERVTVKAEGDVELNGFFGLVEGSRPGFNRVRLAVTLEGPETPERFREFADLVDRHCPVLDMLSTPAPVERTLVDPEAPAAP